MAMKKKASKHQEVLITDPDSPPVWAMPLDDVPFVAEMCDEFPTCLKSMRHEGTQLQLAQTHM